MYFKVLRKRILKTDTYNRKIRQNLLEAKTQCETMHRILIKHNTHKLQVDITNHTDVHRYATSSTAALQFIFCKKKRHCFNEDFASFKSAGYSLRRLRR